MRINIDKSNKIALAVQIFYFRFSRPQFDDLKAPVGRVHFAGEAYSQSFYGTMQGALLSGRDTGKTIAQCMIAKTPDTDCGRHTPRYDAKGCTYEKASDYKPHVLVDDGSCVFDVEKDNVTGVATAVKHSLPFLVFCLISWLC